MSKTKTYVKAILIPLLLGAATGLITQGSMNYSTLQKPALSPPAILFPIVWSALYILMGVSWGMIELEGERDASLKRLYYIQLGVNLLWPVVFFTLRWRLVAFFVIILLDVLVAVMILRFSKVKRTAAYLQIPYMLWILFATYLNLGVYLLNR